MGLDADGKQTACSSTWITETRTQGMHHVFLVEHWGMCFPVTTYRLAGYSIYHLVLFSSLAGGEGGFVTEA